MKGSFPHYCSALPDPLPEDLAVSTSDLSQGSRYGNGRQRRQESLELSKDVETYGMLRGL